MKCFLHLHKRRSFVLFVQAGAIPFVKREGAAFFRDLDDYVTHANNRFP